MKGGVEGEMCGGEGGGGGVNGQGHCVTIGSVRWEGASVLQEDRHHAAESIWVETFGSQQA